MLARETPMAPGKFDLKDLERRMRGAIDMLKKEFGGLRTGRASVHLLDAVVVNVYGSRMPINQVATVSTPDARTISVQVWDRGQVTAVEKAIREANLGLNPVTEGALIRLPIPALNAERRQELVKVAHKYAEHARVVVRNVRREGMEMLKKLDKEGQMSQDDHHKNSAKVQELTDRLIKEIDQTLAGKETEIRQV
jgi:ribosome recycling factor